MKFNLSITLTLLVFIGSHVALSQKRGKKGKSTSSDMLNMTFERLQEDEEVSELGSITLLDNGVFSPTENAADLFRRGLAQLQEFQIMHLEARRVMWMVGKCMQDLLPTDQDENLLSEAI